MSSRSSNKTRNTPTKARTTRVPRKAESEDALAKLPLAALRAKYKSVLGRETKSKDCARLAKEIAAEFAKATTRDDGPRRGGRVGRFTGMSIEQLRALYLEKVGRPTGSTDKRYLEWKIREAEKGRVPVGAIERRVGLPPEQMMTLPWRLPRVVVATVDEAAERLGIKTRSALLTLALSELFGARGESAAAAAVRGDDAGSAGA